MSNSNDPAVLVSIVTRNEEAFLENCLESLVSQTVGVKVVVFDNNSSDRTVEIAERFGVLTTRSPENVGFSRGHNLNLRQGDYDFALVLNADTILDPDYVECMIGTLSRFENAGMACGKIFRMDKSGERVRGKSGFLLDSTGIYFTPTQRHFDRGSNEDDLGQYETTEFVFGVSGAVLFCRREMIDDLKMGEEFLDEDFFAYREDADLAWRAQLRGWKAVYSPASTARHFRTVLPARRRELEALVNYHSVKNRFLMRTKNMDWAVWWKCFPYLWLRDLGILGYLLLRERSSLSALARVRELGVRTREKRRIVQAKRTVSGRRLARWFSFKPVSFRAPEENAVENRSGDFG